MKKLISVICAVALITSLFCIAAPAAEPEVTFEITANPVETGDTTLTAVVSAVLPEDASGYELGAFKLFVNYSTKLMSLSKEPQWLIDGLTVSSEHLSATPYALLWADTDPVFKAGTTLIAILDFNLNRPAEDGTEYTLSLSLDDEAMPFSMPSKELSLAEKEYTADQIALNSSTVTAHTHSYSSTIVPPTETTEGYILYTCDICGYSYITGLGVQLIIGDINDDGDVSLADVTLLLKHLASWDVTINSIAADANADNAVNLADVTLLLKYLAGWDVTLGNPA